MQPGQHVEHAVHGLAWWGWHAFTQRCTPVQRASGSGRAEGEAQQKGSTIKASWVQSIINGVAPF